jgi:hypothetical protein
MTTSSYESLSHAKWDGKYHGVFETIAFLPGFGMAPVGYVSYSAGPNMRAGRTKPCSVRGRIDPIPPKG